MRTPTVAAVVVTVFAAIGAWWLGVRAGREAARPPSPRRDLGPVASADVADAVEVIDGVAATPVAAR